MAMLHEAARKEIYEEQKRVYNRILEKYKHDEEINGTKLAELWNNTYTFNAENCWKVFIFSYYTSFFVF